MKAQELETLSANKQKTNFFMLFIFESETKQKPLKRGLKSYFETSQKV
jgi:hypothetical protein